MLLFLTLLDSPREQEKFKEIYEQYRHFMWYIANQRLQDEQLAEDAVQEAFLALTRHLDKITDVHAGATRSFLATIVRSKAADILRRRKPETSYEDGIPEAASREDDLLEQYVTKENYRHLISCVLELDDQYRVVFEYKYLYRMSDAQIADILGITAKNVNVRYFRARRKLQEMIRREVERA